MKPKTSTLSSTEKALKILMAFTPSNQELGTLELSERLQIHKSTVSRLLHILTAHGFLQQNPSTKKYSLGRSAARIGEAVIKAVNTTIVSIALPHLVALSARMGESIALEVLSGTDVYLAQHVEGQQPIRFSFKPGEQVPVHVTAGAKAILAYCETSLVDSCLKKQKMVRYTPHTIVSVKRFRTELARVRTTGVAYDRGERYEDVHAMATPIFNHEGAAVAAVVMAGPAFRMTPAFLAEAIAPMKATAAAISQGLHH
jgi:DNA-binding IclR family transcriptional regulator